MYATRMITGHLFKAVVWRVAAGLVPVVMPVQADAAHPALMWIEANEKGKDDYVAFRGTLELDGDADVEIRTLGASWFVLWLDGDYLTEGPARFEIQHPEYDITRIRLSAGRHVLSAQVHHIGETTRILVDMPPFLYCRLYQDDRQLPVTWKCARLPGYRSQVRRVNPQLGWIEWCDTQKNPANWQSPPFDDASWTVPVKAGTKLGKLAPANIGPVKHFTHELKPMAEGPLAERFGYELDDIPARFFLRDLTCADLPPQGLWRRYDLGRVRLGRPRFVLDLPEGAVVEFATCEALSDGRVSPYITLSAGPSCNLDHYVARGGAQEFFPLTPKGGRFLEIHILADPKRIKFVQERFIERGYHDRPEGAFSCADALLDRIWMTGVETYRACAEDALIDNPTRERGQWTGDVVSVGMDIASVVYSDLRLCRRGLVQSALCARKDGLIAGLCPGGPAYLPSYSAQWVAACLHYYTLTGDRTLLEELYPYATGNIAALERFVTQDGLTDGAGWVFIDWGYVRNSGPADIAYNLHFLAALRTMTEWCDILEHPEDRAKYERLAAKIRTVIQAWLQKNLADTKEGWERIGYHTAVLALSLGLIPDDHEAACIRAIKRHILNCFPNNPDAPRLSAPDKASRQLITPYFAHYAFPPLIERGQMDFVLDQYRKCWGWMLQDGRTTWVEVFDTRWSHCHQWAGAPTWQLSRYVLGLHPRFDRGKNHFDFVFFPGSLPQAKGRLPLPDGKGSVQIQWTRKRDGVHYSVQTPVPIWVRLPPQEGRRDAKIVKIQTRHDMILP